MIFLESIYCTKKVLYEVFQFLTQSQKIRHFYQKKGYAKFFVQKDTFFQKQCTPVYFRLYGQRRLGLFPASFVLHKMNGMNSASG